MSRIFWKAVPRFFGWGLAYSMTFLVVSAFVPHRAVRPLWLLALIVSAGSAALRTVFYWQSSQEAQPPSILGAADTCQKH